MTEKYDALAETLGAERSARVRYQKAHDAQQKRIRELEAALKNAVSLYDNLFIVPNERCGQKNLVSTDTAFEKFRAILKGAK